MLRFVKLVEIARTLLKKINNFSCAFGDHNWIYSEVHYNFDPVCMGDRARRTRKCKHCGTEQSGKYGIIGIAEYGWQWKDTIGPEKIYPPDDIC